MDKFGPAGFFVMRTPLLPLAELLSWSDGLTAPAALDNAARLDPALAADRDLLRARLREAISRPEVRDALFIASPDLDSAIDLWIREPESEKGQRAERALVRYYQRMAARATPFGLFAGGSTGAIGQRTDLALGERAGYQRHTRLDMDYLFALVEALAKSPEVLSARLYRS